MGTTSRPRAEKLAAASAVAAILALPPAYLALFPNGQDSNAPITAAPVTTPPNAASIPAPRTGKATDETVVPTEREIYLADLEGPVDQGADRACGSYESGSFDVGQRSYEQSVAIRQECSNQSYSAWLQYNVPPTCYELDAVVGLSNNAADTARAALRVSFNDGTRYARGSVQLVPGHAHRLRIPVRDKFRVKLLTATRPLGSGRVFDDWFTVFGDAKFKCS